MIGSKEANKALQILMPTLEGLAEDRGDTVKAYIKYDDRVDREQIVVEINGYEYAIEVTASSVRSMVRSVVDAVALKF